MLVTVHSSQVQRVAATFSPTVDVKPGAPPLPSLHSSKFAPVPEPTIRTGIITMTSAVLDLMKK
jgi:hypothetical protein